jgi:hypothetical protein
VASNRPFLALLPALINAALVAFMIGTGIARGRHNVRGNQDRLAQASQALRGFGDDAARFLASRQAPDGSWPGAAAADVALTARILLNVRGTGYEGQPFYGRGLAFVRAHRERLHAWLRGGGGGAEPSPGPFEPTLEALALGGLLLGQEAEGDDGAALRKALGPLPAAGGLYPHALARDPGGRPAAESRVGDNVLALGLLPAAKLDPAPLAARVRTALADAPPATPGSVLALAYEASLAAETGSPEARSLVAPLLDRLDPAALGPGSGLDDLSLATYVHLRGRRCVAEADPCNNLNPAMGTLATRRQADGSWSAAALAGGPRSADEATSMALKAVATYRGIVEGRITATPSPEPGAVPRRR